MNLTVFILFIFGLQIICLITGRKYSKGLKNQEDYFLAGKTIRFFPLMMTFLATQVGGGLILGSAEEAYQFGWSVLFYPLGASLGLLVLGLGIGRRLAQFQVSTVAQIFEVVYRSSKLKKIASIFSIVSLFLVLVAQIVASNKFMISLGVENQIWFLAFWGIVILYTALGGLKAIVATDIVQAAFFISAFILCFGYAIYSADNSFVQIVEMGFTNKNFSFDSSKLLGWLLMPMIFIVIGQDMGQRCFAADSPKTVSKATLWAAVCTMVISVIPVFFGVYARTMNIDVPEGASVLITVIKQTTTPLITALAGCAILAAIISTADALINAIGSNLSQDFGYSSLKRDNIRFSQIIAVIISITAIFFSFYNKNIVDLLILSYDLSVSCLFVPIIIALFKRQGNVLSASLAIAFGALSFVLFRIFPIELPKEILTIAFSFLGFGLGEMVMWKRNQRIKQGITIYD